MTRLPENEPLPPARALYEAQVEATDAATRTALRSRRQKALSTLDAPPALRWWLPAGGFATAALALALVLPRMNEPASRAPGAVEVASRESEPPLADSALLAEGASLELENDAEFYAWLADAPADEDDFGDAPIHDNTLPPPAEDQEGWTL